MSGMSGKSPKTNKAKEGKDTVVIKKRNIKNKVKSPKKTVEKGAKSVSAPKEGIVKGKHTELTEEQIMEMFGL